MQILKENVPFREILQRYNEEHSGWEGYEIGLEYLNAANERCNSKWALVLLSSDDILRVMLPPHSHPIEVIPKAGLSVSDSVQRLKQLPKEEMPNCWQRICGIKDRRDFSRICIALENVNGIMKHVDGVHRLLAYGLAETDQEVEAYVAGDTPSLPTSR
jgi:hypothetical protein